jgi:type IV pilus assembly protein PilM
MRFFGKTSVGLEMDSFEARVVELSGSTNAPKLERYGRVGLPAGAVKDGVVLNPGKVATALNELWVKNKIKSKEVILGVSNQDVLVRLANFPKVPYDKLANLIRYQAQELLPMPLNSVEMDHIVINEAGGENGKALEVLLVAARKTMLSGFLASLSSAGLRPTDIDVTSLALARMVSGQDAIDGTAVVYLDGDMGNILLLVKGVPRLARLMPVGFRSVLNKIAAGQNEYSDISSSIDCISSDSVTAYCDAVSREVQSCINYYYVQNASEHVRKIILCGNGSRIKGLDERLKADIGVPVVFLNTLERISVSKDCPGMDMAKASGYTVSFSLALRGLEA